MMALVDLLDRPIAYHAIYRTITGSTVAALFLSQCCYWQRIVDAGKGGEDGWFYKTISEFEQETGLSRHEQGTARRKLLELRILKEKKIGMPRKLYYRVNWDVLEKILAEYQHNTVIPHPENPKVGIPLTANSSNMSAGPSPKNYIVPETTAESTTTTAGAALIDRYVETASNNKNPENRNSYEAVIRRRIAKQGGLTIQELEQLEEWQTKSKSLPHLVEGDVIVWGNGKNETITEVLDGNYILDHGRSVSSGELIKRWRNEELTLYDRNNNTKE